MARWTSAAATAESTPPDSPQMARPSPTCSRIAVTCSSTMFSMVQDGRQPASSRKRPRTRAPCSVCRTSGWNCTPNRRSLVFSTAATGVASVRAVTAKPGGAAVQVSPCDIQTRWLFGVPASRAPPVFCQRRRAVFGRAGALDRAAEAGHHQLESVADAEDRHPGVEQARRGGRRAVGVDRRGAAGQDDRLRPLGQHLRHRHGGGDDLGVHVALAHPAGDQLRVLRAEVDDEDGVKATGHADHLSLVRGLRV